MTIVPLVKKKMMGEIFVESEILTPEQLLTALDVQKKTGKRLGEVLAELNMVTEDQIVGTLSKQLGFPHVWLRKGLIDPKIVNIIPKEKAKLHNIIPMFKVKGNLFIATVDPQAVFVFDELMKITRCTIHPILCRATDIKDAIEEYYDEKIEITNFLAELEGQEIQLVESIREEDYQNIEETAEGSPVINLVNLIILKAIKDRASDIHIEPERRKFRIRYRIDGILYEAMSPKIELYPAVISRLKIMAKLDISERRLPQEGRIQVYIEGRTVDLRFSSLPGIHGEKIVLRVLDKKNAILDINELGFDNEILVRFKKLLKRPFGLILVTGPTGSGKTTTLYSAISMLNSIEKNIVTIEDPVEYQLEIVNQNQINDSLGLSFAKILKHSLRQDPDIILVGEIRERETAEVAIQASLTGHLVFSTLHTNDSASAITRLIDMGVESYLISSSLIGIIAQRLIRLICPECKTNYFPSSTLLDNLGWGCEKDLQLVKGKGCISCYDSGYKGRIGIFEYLEVDREFQSLMLNNPSVNMIREFREKIGYPSLRMEGLKKVKQGLTTLEEVEIAIQTE
ncbi:MAG: Flp pilus assembly complex ATPase component TadA [Nitrospinae bacterium]|nr:Flp pilus assembly complex ATPase component TadA [Nitrospinota bacterium]